MWFGRLRIPITASEMTLLVCADSSRGSTTLHAHPSRNIQPFWCAAQLHSLIPLTPKPLDSLQVYSAEMWSKSGQKLPEFLFTPDPLPWHCCRLWELKECHFPQSCVPLVTQKDSGKGKALSSFCTISRSRTNLSSVTHLALVAAHHLQAQQDLEGMIFPTRPTNRHLGVGRVWASLVRDSKSWERRRCSVCSALPHLNKDAPCFKDGAAACLGHPDVSLGHPPQTPLLNFSPWKNIAHQAVCLDSLPSPKLPCHDNLRGSWSSPTSLRELLPSLCKLSTSSVKTGRIYAQQTFPRSQYFPVTYSWLVNTNLTQLVPPLMIPLQYVLSWYSVISHWGIHPCQKGFVHKNISSHTIIGCYIHSSFLCHLMLPNPTHWHQSQGENKTINWQLIKL